MFDLKSTEELHLMTFKINTKFEEKMTCASKNLMKNLEIFTRALESLQNGTLMASFCLKLKMYELKLTGELCVMTFKNDAKIEEELTCQFEIDMRNLTNFDSSTQKSQKIFTLMGFF